MQSEEVVKEGLVGINWVLGMTLLGIMLSWVWYLPIKMHVLIMWNVLAEAMCWSEPLATADCLDPLQLQKRNSATVNAGRSPRESPDRAILY
jgi:hypothetical protein